MKKLLEVQDCKLANHLEVEVYYSLGGMNYFTGKNEGRGYYLSVTPVKIEGGFRTVTAFTGVRILVKAVSRKSDKAYKEAVELSKEKEVELIDYVCRKNNLTLKECVA